MEPAAARQAASPSRSLFTAPTVVAQPISGILLTDQLNRPYGTVWFAAVALLYVLAGLCWIPVFIIQYRLRNLARGAESYRDISPEFERLMRICIALGIPAFAAVLAIVALMVTGAGAGMPLRQ